MCVGQCSSNSKAGKTQSEIARNLRVRGAGGRDYFGVLQGSDDVGHAGDSFVVEEFGGEAGGQAGGVEAGGADLDGGGSGDKEFHDVVEILNSADSDDGDVDSLCYLADGAESHRFDRRAAEASEDVAENWLAAASVDGRVQFSDRLVVKEELFQECFFPSRAITSAVGSPCTSPL